MPEMTGDELIARMREQRPHLKALIITGHVDLLERESPDWWRADPHLAKPFRLQALRDAVETLIGQGSGAVTCLEAEVTRPPAPSDPLLV